MSELRVTIDGKSVVCDRRHYVTAKTKQLREFGYPSLTEKEVDEQVSAVLAGKKLLEGLDVIGGFIKGEISEL